MLSSKLLCLFLLPLSFESPERESDPPKVVLMLNNGEEFSGEILAVRDRTMIISTIYGASEEVLEKRIHNVKAMELDSIKQLKVRGKSYLVTGMAWGGSIGAVTGAVIGATGNTSEGSEITGINCGGGPGDAVGTGALGCTIGLGVGLLLGASVGRAFSGRDSIMFVSTASATITLKTLARYQDQEPEFLRAVGK